MKDALLSVLMIGTVVVCRAGTDYWVSPDGTGDGTGAQAPGNLQDVLKNKATSAGDCVHLATGTYDFAVIESCNDYCHLNVAAGVSLVGGSDDPSETVLKGNGTRRVMVVEKGVSVRNLTVRGGNTPYQGGGIDGYQQFNPVQDFYTTSNCVIERCTAAYEGGGVAWGTHYDTVIRHCRVTNTRFDADSLYAGVGGGAYGATLVRCLVVSNSAGWGGGGLGARVSASGVGEQGYGRAIGCTFMFNEGTYGGAISTGAGSADAIKVYDSTIVSNTATSLGGGVHGAAVISNCVVAANWSGLYGGGMSDVGLVQNCHVVGNTAEYGCGLFASSTHGGMRVEGSLIGSNVSFRTGVDLNSTFGGVGACGAMTLARCRILGNRSDNVLGGGTYNTTNIECLIEGNHGNHGGGMMKGFARKCRILGNSSVYHGAAVYNGNTENCWIEGNVFAGANGWGTVFRGHHFGDVVVNNGPTWGWQAYGTAFGNYGQDSDDPMSVVNCTVIGNPNGVQVACCSVTNSVVVGAEGLDWDVAYLRGASHCYFSLQKANPQEGEEACLRGDNPKFIANPASPEERYLPRISSPLVDAGLTLPGMAEATDIRGSSRVKYGAVDIGAYEVFGNLGTLVVFR